MTAQPANNNADPASDLAAIGKYRLLATLAQGGMGKVYLGLMAGPAGFNKLLVIKVMTRSDELPGEDAVQQFLDEARLAARAIHSNIVHTYEVGEAEGTYFLAMEYLDGQSLRTVQSRLPDDRIPLVAQLRILSEVARGLQYAHDLKDYKGEPLGVVHRDVSPQNVFITYDGQVKLLDFGIAKSYDAGHKTKVGVIKGKLDYIAPEQLRGDHIDARADIFALGVMLWEAVTGKRFSGGRGTPEVRKMHARLTGGEPKLSIVAPDAPEALVSMIEQTLAINPSERWQSAGGLADALDSYIESTGQRPSAKSLSEAMTGIFADERKRMHKLIEQQIEETRGRPPSSRPLPTFSMHGTSTVTPSAAQVPSMDGEATREDAHVDAVTHATSGARPVAASPSRKLRWGVGTAVATAVVTGGLLLEQPRATRSPGNAGEVPQAIDAAIASEPKEAPKPLAEALLRASPGNVTIRIRVSTPDAQLTLDGVHVALPFQGEFRSSSELHRIEVTAKGHQRDTRLVDFRRDQAIDIELVPSSPRMRRDGRNIARPSTAPAGDSQPSAPPQSTPESRAIVEDDVPVKPRAKATIDLDNPY